MPSTVTVSSTAGDVLLNRPSLTTMLTVRGPSTGSSASLWYSRLESTCSYSVVEPRPSISSTAPPAPPLRLNVELRFCAFTAKYSCADPAASGAGCRCTNARCSRNSSAWSASEMLTQPWPPGASSATASPAVPSTKVTAAPSAEAESTGAWSLIMRW